jgi:hypothetical protein
LQEELHRGTNVATGDDSKDDNEEEEIGLEGEFDGEVLNHAEERLFRAITKFGKRPTIEVGVFSRNLKPDELIDWINELEEYFEYEDIRDPDRVKFAKAKLKGHAKIWWQEVQLERNRRGKEKITRWDRMVDKLKKQFIPVDYKLDLFKKMHGLKQAGRSVQEYTEEFYRLLIRVGHAEANKEKVAHYISGLRPSIQEELSLVRMTSIEEAYQFSL